MDPEEEAKLAAEAREIAERTGDLRALALLRMADRGASGPGCRTRTTWIAAADEAIAARRRIGRRCTCASRSARRRPTRACCAGDFDGFERWLDEVLELAGGDPSVGAGIVIGNPVAWAHDGQGDGAQGARRIRGGRTAARDGRFELSDETGDPESASWIRGTQAMLRSATGATSRAGSRSAAATAS